MSDNPLGGGGPPPMGPAPYQTDAGPIARGSNPLEDAHAYHKAVHQKISNADRLIKRMREEIDKLVLMGDVVSPEDVVAAAGRVVGHGVPAKEMASLLASMPTQAGQGLAQWVQLQHGQLQQQEAVVAQAKEVALHRMGVSGVRALAASDLQNAARAGTSQMGPLAPGGNQAIASQPQSAPPPMPGGAGPLGPGVR